MVTRLALVLSIGIVVGSLLVIRRQMRAAVEQEAQMHANWVRLAHHVAAARVYAQATARRQLVGNEDFEEWERELHDRSER